MTAWTTRETPRMTQTFTTLQPGDRVRVFYKGAVGVPDRRVVRTVVRVTKLQAILSDGERFNLTTGYRQGETRSRWGTPSGIIEKVG
jgi:hypothetical protein